MIPLPLDDEEMTALLADMRRGPYLLQPSVQLLNLDHEILSDLSERVLDGQVDCSLSGTTTTRSLTVTLADPTREVPLDGADAADGALFYDKMIRAGVRIKGPRLGRWVTIPLFCGPLTNASRTGWTAQVTAQGKERLATGQVWDPTTYPAGSRKTDTIADLLVATGETRRRLHVPDLRARQPKDLTLRRTDTTWPSVSQLATSLNRQAMYDGRGDFRLRRWPDDPRARFRDGNGGTILTDPVVTYDEYSGWNGVLVRGPLKRTGRTIQVARWLPRQHQLSPWARRRGGVPFRRAYVVTENSLRSRAEAVEIADRYMRRLVRETVKVTVDVMPHWLLEPGDVYAITTTAVGYLEQQITEMSIPLTGGTPMSLGATKRLRRPGQPVTGRTGTTRVRTATSHTPGTTALTPARNRGLPR
ncbi:hypothetical protein [Nocardioides bruguierae]|uniref:Phage tail protein n=1 Tax=Nocardioides bruguierae TaxID=2945102 RepID=A0A9X2DB51_9ACTN|nr:hypothetical protein [Nocardioides bruguierae]MCM0622516.1 hypothetical protein [Nocardioides bruguierae]